MGARLFFLVDLLSFIGRLFVEFFFSFLPFSLSFCWSILRLHLIIDITKVDLCETTSILYQSSIHSWQKDFVLHRNMSKYKSTNSLIKTHQSTASFPKEEVNVVLLGKQSVGKSALVVKYLTKRFICEYDPFLGRFFLWISRSISLHCRPTIFRRHLLENWCRRSTRSFSQNNGHLRQGF